MKIKSRGLLLLSAAPLVLSAIGYAAPAFAQTTTPTTEDGAAPTPAAGPLAQTGTPAASADGTTQGGGEIVITGSRIPQPNLTGVSPVTVVNQQDFKLQGTTRTEDLLNSLPQVFADQGSAVSNGATGTATVNLRNLGANRTLVLINGRRLVPGDPTDSSADINFIPSSMIKRVDVLTGGASATYGADAVGGVVNFILDTDFSGFQVDGQYSFNQHENGASSAVRGALAARNFGYPDGNSADGGTVDATVKFGAGFDDNRGHVTAYIGYRKIDAITQDKRDYSSCALSATKAGALSCGGSATSANGTVISFAGGSPTDTLKNGTAAPYSGGTSTYFQVGANRTLVGGFTPFNYAPTNYYQRPDERYTAGFFANYEISDAVKPYIEGMFMDDRSIAQIAPSGDFGNTFSINSDNPLLSAQQRAVLFNQGNLVVQSRDPVTGAFTPPPVNAPPSTVTSDAQNGFYNSAPYNFIDPTTGVAYQRGFAQILKRNVEGAPRQDDLQHTSFRIVLGTKGDLNDAFSYDAYYQYGRTNFNETYLNDFSITRLRRALDVVSNNGVATCRSVVDGSDPNCVPYNIWTQGGVTPQAVAYLATPGFQRGQTTEQVASFNVTGLLGKYGIKSPLASDGVGVNVGFEYRREALNLNTDLEFQTGDLSGQGAATLPVNGAFNVYEGYGEVRVPIIQQGFVYDLSFDGGYRHSSYEVGNRNFDTNTYKLGGEFAPIRQVRLRGAYNRAVRAPNIQEFFAPQRVAIDGATDPCANRVLTAADAGCLAQGLRVGQTVVANPSGQYNGLIGGNPNLTPEKADTYTVGVVLQPDFIPALRGLAVTVDYFNINVTNIVSTIGADTILSQCTNDATSPFCGLINRDSSGSLWRSPAGYTIDLTQNIGSLLTAGIDVGASYSHELGGLGSLGLNFNGTYLDKLVVNNGVSDAYDCAGLYGNQCGTPSPEWRHKFRATINLPNGIGFSGQWRYFSAVRVDTSSQYTSLNPTNAAGQPTNNFTAFNSRISPQSYFDLAMTATINEHYNFRIGVQNLLDKDPPLVPSAGSYSQAGFQNGNTYPTVYEALGRYIYAAATVSF
jgi:iron complex outermembrane receptor protein